MQINSHIYNMKEFLNEYSELFKLAGIARRINARVPNFSMWVRDEPYRYLSAKEELNLKVFLIRLRDKLNEMEL